MTGRSQVNGPSIFFVIRDSVFWIDLARRHAWGRIASGKVSERVQTLDRFRTERVRPRLGAGLVNRAQLRQSLAIGRSDGDLAWVKVRQLAGVLREIVKLRPRSLDVLVVPAPQGGKSTRSEMPLRVEAFAEHSSRRAARSEHADALHRLRDWKLHRVENRRGKIQQAGRSVDSLGHRSFTRRPVNDQWHMQGALIDEKPVRGFAVVS